MNITELQRCIYRDAEQNGFYSRPQNILQNVALLHSELSEVLEADRKDRYVTVDAVIALTTIDPCKECDLYIERFEEGIKNTFEDALADVFIRLLGLAEDCGVNLEWHVLKKMAYNKTRDYDDKKY